MHPARHRPNTLTDLNTLVQWWHDLTWHDLTWRDLTWRWYYTRAPALDIIGLADSKAKGSLLGAEFTHNDTGRNKALTWREKGKAWPGLAESRLTRLTLDEDDPLEAHKYGERTKPSRRKGQLGSPDHIIITMYFILYFYFIIIK